MTALIVVWLAIVWFIAALMPGWWALPLLCLPLGLAGAWWIWAGWYVVQPSDGREE